MSKKDKKKIIDSESGKMHFEGDHTMPSTRESTLGNPSDVIDKFVPLFGIVDQVIKSLNTIYENAKYNKIMCLGLIDRIEVAEQATKSLRRKRQENAKKFSDEKYYRAWVRFTNILKNIKDFAEDVTQLSMFRKYLNTNAVKEAYDKNIKEFEDVCKDLHLSVFISVEQREWNEKYFATDKYSIGTKKLNSGEIKVPYVKSSELTDPKTKPGNVRGSERSIVKRNYRGTLDVACKKVQAIEKNSTAKSRSIQTQLVILDLLGKCPYIITFYGLSEIDKIDYMIFEWAEHGSLKEVYEKSSIPLPTKLQFISNIFKGLFFISNSGVLHHDVRCENILVTENCDVNVKISNFEMSRQIQEDSTTIPGLNDYVRWLAPEKMRDLKYRYNHKCEIFSFGMLVWELINEKIPYKNMSFDEVQEHVKSKKREILPRFNSDPILLGLTKLIKQTWDDEPLLRPSYPETFNLINNLERSVQLNSPRIYPKNDTHDDIPSFENISPHYDIDPQKLPDWDECDPGDGIKAHREKRYKEAWECFNEHANLGLSLAKYWKGYYLVKGFHGEKDIKEGLKWLKLAADDGVPDAQLRYASGLINLNISNGSSENYEIILKYMKKAADGGSEIALYNLSAIYLHGKLGVEKDEKKGNEFFKLAVLKNPKFIKFR
ncbi:1540_t:CDS:2 [Diversispora eburnea]|uniref:1540_t:CDS:1 n=1 Tax=Diversispora eburnea TaxID=1213867 RepID=A0A9N9EWY6_9GLOM|nr:1540_t:CDS:2 [Diversispora eburnea]